MKKLAYFYPNITQSKEIQSSNLYPGEKIIFKCEEIKFEDDIRNKEYDTKTYFTNFRILVFTDKIIFDVPLSFVKTHYVKKPMLYGSKYIYIEFTIGNHKAFLPKYILENISISDITATTYQLPKYLMLKFRGKDSDIDQAYNILKMMLETKDWNISHVKQQDENEQLNKPSTSTNVTGIGLERTKNIIMTQIKENREVISGSFTDIQSLRGNAQQMIDIAQGLRTKLGSNVKNDPTMNQIDQVLFSIGFVDPVTKETAGKDYYLNLAKQISSYFSEYFSKNNVGILSLIDAYCYYNRSRGINTISPKDMKEALNHFTNINTNIHVKVCKNEMILLHTEEFSVENLFEKLKKFLNAEKPFVILKDFTELISNKNQLLSKILIEEMLDQGLLASDESDLELRYYENKILKYKI